MRTLYTVLIYTVLNFVFLSALAAAPSCPKNIESLSELKGKGLGVFAGPVVLYRIRTDGSAVRTSFVRPIVDPVDLDLVPSSISPELVIAGNISHELVNLSGLISQAALALGNSSLLLRDLIIDNGTVVGANLWVRLKYSEWMEAQKLNGAKSSSGKSSRKRTGFLAGISAMRLVENERGDFSVDGAQDVFVQLDNNEWVKAAVPLNTGLMSFQAIALNSIGRTISFTTKDGYLTSLEVVPPVAVE